MGTIQQKFAPKLPPPPLHPPPPPPRETVTSMFFLVNIYCASFCCPSALHMALHCFKSITCVCSVLFSLQRRCMGVLCCYFRPGGSQKSDTMRGFGPPPL